MRSGIKAPDHSGAQTEREQSVVRQTGDMWDPASILRPGPRAEPKAQPYMEECLPPHLCGLPMFTCSFGKQNAEQGSGRTRLIRALGTGHRLRLRAPGGCFQEEAGAVFSPGFCSLYEVPVGTGGKTWGRSAKVSQHKCLCFLIISTETRAGGMVGDRSSLPLYPDLPRLP